MTINTDFLPQPDQMDYLMIREADGVVFAVVTYHKAMCFFYHTAMFQNGRWVDSYAEKGFVCVRADLCHQFEGRALIFDSVAKREAYETHEKTRQGAN
jgi:hypothetical protein